MIFTIAVLSRTYEQCDCALDVVREVASDSSGDNEIDDAFSAVLFVGVDETDEILLVLCLLSFIVGEVCPDEIVDGSRWSKVLCFLLQVVHNLDLQFLLEWPDLKQFTHSLCF